jgi:hypothetical protein
MFQIRGSVLGCLSFLLFTHRTPNTSDLNVTEHNESEKSRQGNWEQTSVSRWKDNPDPLPDTDVVMYPSRIDKFETVTPGRGFLRVIVDSVKTMKQYGGVSIEIGEGLATCTTLDRQVVLESGGYRSATWRTLRALQQVHGAKEIWGFTCVTSPPFFSQRGSPVGRSYEAATGKPVVIMWDGLRGPTRIDEG